MASMSEAGRLRLSPDGGEGGGGGPAGGNPPPNPGPNPAPSPGPAPSDPRPADRDPGNGDRRDPNANPNPGTSPSPQPPPDPAVSGWATERKQVLAELDRYRREEAQRQSAEREAEQERLKKAGEWEKLETRYQEELRRRDEHVAAKDRQYADSILDRDLAVALSAYPWVDGGAEAVAKLIRGELETYEHEGTIRSRSKDTFKDLGEHLRNKVEKDPLLRHLIRAEGRPGSGATDPHRPGSGSHERPRDPGEPNDDPNVLSARKFFADTGRGGSNNSAGYRIG